eukprot:c18185_g1_i1 orf=149-868(+)
MSALRGLQRGAAARRYWGHSSRHFTRSLAVPSSSPSAATTSEKEEDGRPSLFSSWVGKVKGVFQGQPSPQHPPPQPEQQPPSLPAYTLLDCADELKSARRISKVTTLLKKQTHVPEGAVSESLERCETIMRVLANHDPTGQTVDERQKAAVAKECGCTIQEINRMLTKFEWMKEARAKLLQMKEKGEELPKTMAEVEKLLKGSSPKHNLSRNQSVEVGRNAPCTCGSGKKYKRCCGRGT